MPLRRRPEQKLFSLVPAETAIHRSSGVDIFVRTNWTGTQLDTALGFVSSPSANRLDTITTEHSYETYCHCASSGKGPRFVPAHIATPLSAEKWVEACGTRLCLRQRSPAHSDDADRGHHLKANVPDRIGRSRHRR